ncbi:MAG: MerR family transcriptional regulator [Actinobacteria bacterium]|nr:MerR family transcriptional regulator [Actinomycetota bacterium]
MNDEAPHRIGEVARKLGVSTRTLRYYQELGLMNPAGVSQGGNRRYSDADVTRAERILELRNVMGFDLERIGEILAAEDRLADMRAEAKRGVTRARRREILAEAIEIDNGLRRQVADKIAVLAGFDRDLQAHLERLRGIAAEMGEPELDGTTAAAEA